MNKLNNPDLVIFIFIDRDFIQATRDDIEALHSRTVDQTTTSQVRDRMPLHTSNNTMLSAKILSNLTDKPTLSNKPLKSFQDSLKFFF